MKPAGPIRAFVRTPDAATREVFHSMTRALCPACGELVDAARVLRGGKVFLRRHCATHGASEALIAGDEEWFLAQWDFTKPGSIPFGFAREVKDGCPHDCGLCPDHEQHTCLPIIEITNHCNMDCPICLVDNRDDAHLGVEAVREIVDGLVAREGSLETVNFSGGEPTLHPQFLEILDAARRPEIARLSVSTNGVRLAADEALCAELARRHVYVNLQLDGLEPEALAKLRGPGDHVTVKRRALENLERAGVPTTLIMTVARGVNEHLIGQCVKLFLESDFLLSLMIQPAAHRGRGESFAPHDPRDVLTIPDVVRACEEQTGGLLGAGDFVPLPCSHPGCFALTYLLRAEGAWVPFPRFVDVGAYLDLLANRGTIRPDGALEDSLRRAIDELWSASGQAPDGERILKSLKRCLREMYPEDRALELEERLRIGEGQVKTLFIHAFMDDHTFDLDRIKKCCNHYALSDGRLIPGCAYNALYRNAP